MEEYRGTGEVGVGDGAIVHPQPSAPIFWDFFSNVNFFKFLKISKRINNITKYCFLQFQVRTLLPRWKMANMFISFSVNKQLNISIVARYVHTFLG